MVSHYLIIAVNLPKNLLYRKVMQVMCAKAELDILDVLD